MLAKFHTSSEWIKTLWLVAVPATVVGVSWCVSQVLREAIRAVRPGRRGGPEVPAPEGADGAAPAAWRLVGRDGAVWLRLPPPAEPWPAPGRLTHGDERS
jgi:hypothetical protein